MQSNGLIYGLPPLATPIHDIVVYFESSIQDLSEDKKQFVKHACHRKIEKNISVFSASKAHSQAYTLENKKKKNRFF
jgi:hypothetical protein